MGQISRDVTFYIEAGVVRVYVGLRGVNKCTVQERDY